MNIRDASPDTVALAVGQSVRFHDVDVGFSGVREDTRCAIDVVCVRPGNAVVDVVVGPAFGRGPTYQLLLNTTEGTREGVAWAVRVVLVDLLPVPLAAQRPDHDSYVVTLSIGGADVRSP